MILVIATMGFGGLRAAPPHPATTESNITRLTTNVLENSQFAHHPFDSELAGTLLERYMDALDRTRSLLLQTDVAEFMSQRAALAEATRGVGSTDVAQAIFKRYLERLGQRVSYGAKLLKTGSFDFTGHDAYVFDRQHAERPRDLTAAEGLWKQQIRAEYLQEKLADKKPEQVVKTLLQRGEQELRTMRALQGDEVLEIYLDALAHVYDPHSDYLGHEQMESLSIAMNLSLVGIGATLEMKDGYCTVRALSAGGPAAKGGVLKLGDRIVAVAQAGKEPVDIANMPISRAVELIRGAKGSTVTLRVLPMDAPEGSLLKTETLVRDEIKLEDQEAKATLVELPTGNGAPTRLGVIDLPSFYADMGEHPGASHRSATTDVARLLEKLKMEHVQGLVLDLRRNGGGSLAEAISLTGLFIRKGPVVQTRNQAGDIEVGADTDPRVQYDGPLVLLTSRFSASASEILAGALQDYGRALIVGDATTFGKGTVQNMLPLARIMDKMHLDHAYDPGAVKITTSKFYRPSGASTQLRGVASDIVLPSVSDFSEVGESALEDPLPWDTVPMAAYAPLNRVAPYVATLREDSERRVLADKGFRYVEDDIARLKRNLSTKSVSLNDAERRQELEEIKARRAERQKDEKTVEATRPTRYAITLENVASPVCHLPSKFTILRKRQRARNPPLSWMTWRKQRRSLRMMSS
jgi:carboxyl-terminal processing protease